MKGNNLLSPLREFEVCEALRCYNKSVHTSCNHAFRGAPFWLGTPENLALHQHNQNKRKESWMVHNEVPQSFWKSQIAPHSKQNLGTYFDFSQHKFSGQ